MVSHSHSCTDPSRLIDTPWYSNNHEAALVLSMASCVGEPGPVLPRRAARAHVHPPALRRGGAQPVLSVSCFDWKKVPSHVVRHENVVEIGVQ